MTEIDKLKEKIKNLEFRIETIETIQHTHDRKHRMIEAGQILYSSC
jgi:prefoldin subunit 5